MAIKPAGSKKSKKSPQKSSASKKAKPSSPGDVSKEEQIGFHKGALSTLAKEREEMLKILSIVEQLMQMHVSALKELGVDLEKIAKQAESAQKSGKSGGKGKPLEAALK